MYIHIYIYVCSSYIPNHGSLQTFLKVKIDGECKYQKVGYPKDPCMVYSPTFTIKSNQNVGVYAIHGSFGLVKGPKFNPYVGDSAYPSHQHPYRPTEGATHCLPCPAGQEVGELNLPVFWGEFFLAVKSGGNQDHTIHGTGIFTYIWLILMVFM